MVKTLKPPKFIFCPFCGEKLIKREDEDRAIRDICPACGWVYYPKPGLTVSVLVRQDRKVLLVKRGHSPKKGFWQLPAGFMEFGEIPSETGIREIKEETNLDVKMGNLINIELVTDDPRGTILGFVYEAKIIGGELKPGDDSVEARYFSLDNLPKIAWEIHRRVLGKLGGKV